MEHTVIVGGYGHVGQKIARRLIAAQMGPVRIVGRDAGRARAVAEDLGCAWAMMDVNAPAHWHHALAACDIVVSCIDTPSGDFAAEVLRRGLSYIDISATDAVLQRIEALDGLAREHDALAVLSVGLAPGLTNLLARAAMDSMEQVEAITIGVLLGLGDEHGPAAINWTLDNLKPLERSDIRMMGFGAQAAATPTIPFAFADQHVLERRGYPPVETRLGLGSPLVTATSLRVLAAVAQKKWAHNLLRWGLSRFRFGSARSALCIEARGRHQGSALIRQIHLNGGGEAEITALMAALVVFRMSERKERGVHHMDGLWDISEFLDALSAEGITIRRDG